MLQWYNRQFSGSSSGQYHVIITHSSRVFVSLSLQSHYSTWSTEYWWHSLNINPDLQQKCVDIVREVDRVISYLLNNTHTVSATKTCQTADYELGCINSICSYLTENATKKLITCVLSTLGCSNSLFMGTPVIQPTQKVQNSAAGLILRALCYLHRTPLL